MPTPRSGYRLADGTRVPSVTTITGRFKDAGGLMYWHWEQGRDGHDFRETKQRAADVGTLTHRMVELSLLGEAVGPRDDDEMELQLLWANDTFVETAHRAFGAFQEWSAGFKLEPVAQEVRLVSEIYRYGGTPDLIARVRGSLCLVDWKTSGAIYPDYQVQIAAYRNLWNENHPDQPLEDGGHILRFSKDYGDFTHKWFSDLDLAWMQFRLFRKAYENDKELNKRAK